MKKYLFAILVFFATNSRAQKIEKFFDYLWHESDASSARFYGVIVHTDSGWHRSDYFIRDNKLQMDGTYEDSACKIANGIFYYFYANGNIEYHGRYLHGKKQGLWLSYHSNGMMSDSTTYENNNPVGIGIGWHNNGYMSDSAVWNSDGSGMDIRWFDNGAVSSAGLFAADRKPKGKWQFFHKSGKPASVELYDNGTLITKQYFDENGNSADTANKDHGAEFPGGNNTWQKYLSKHLYFPDQYQITNSDHAVVVVTFTIDEDGNVKEVEASTPFHPSFDRIAGNVVSKSPKWLPAINHNRKVKDRIVQPVIFQQ